MTARRCGIGHPSVNQRDNTGKLPEYPRYDVLGVSISAVNLEQTIELMGKWVAAGYKDYVVLTGVHGVIEMQKDEGLREINNRSGLTTPDGMPNVWIGRSRGFKHVEKTYGPDIMFESFAQSPRWGFRHFFYGGGEGVAEELKGRMVARYPGLPVVGTYCPPFRALTGDEEREVVSVIDGSGANIVWVGLGCPKQERWMAKFRPLLQAPVLIGVGAAFDFLAARKPLAPAWVKNSGFEWLFRLLFEPRRLWPRYSHIVPKFLYLYAKDSLLKSAGDASGRE